jgi:hypothetical protein
MSHFESQQDLWTVLVNGGTVRDIRDNDHYKFVDGGCHVSRDDGSLVVATCCSFANPYLYEEVKHWYDTVADTSVLCWVSDTNPDKKESTAIIGEYTPNADYPFHPINGGSPWAYATPFSDDDIKLYCLKK